MAPKLIIHTVHGTWPYGLWAQLRRSPPGDVEGQRRPWFLSGSSFQLELAKLTEQNSDWVAFKWSGNNSFRARASAATALAEHMTEWFHREPQANHVIIAHSHGGSVAVGAARILDGQGHNCLTKIITLAAPFAQQLPSERDFRQLLVRYLVLRFGFVPVILFFFFLLIAPSKIPKDADLGIFAFLFMMIPGTPLLWAFVNYLEAMWFGYIPIFALLWRIGILRFKPPVGDFKIKQPKVQGWSLYAVRAPRDEATIAINASQFIDFVSDLLLTRCLIAPFSWILTRLMKAMGILLIVAFLAGIVLTNKWIGGDIASMLLMLALVAPILILQLLAALSAFVVLAAPLILLPATAILAVALGADLVRNWGLLEIECEPIPSGITGTVSTVKLSEDERSQLAMVHYIHATRAARLRVAEILKMPSS